MSSSVRADSSRDEDDDGPLLSQPEWGGAGELEEGRVNHHDDTGEEEGGGRLLSAEEGRKGRAFYEFKEEIRYKRYDEKRPFDSVCNYACAGKL